jgi:ATP-dependent helicase/nuclease subunit A
MAEAVKARAIGDADQRAAALDVERSFIVQAPAGSGKTELLTQRLLRLLAQVSEPEEICAITFTRKAAAEMRNRVMAALDAAAGPPPAQAHRRRTWELARAVLDQDRRQDWSLASNPARLRIQTFDSLAHLLARQMPLRSELGAAPATTERAGPHYRAAARATLRQLDDARLGDDIARLLGHLDNRAGLLEDLLGAMLARRDQWLGHVVAAPSAARLDAGFARIVATGLGQLRAGCPPDWLHELLATAEQAAQSPATGAGPAAGAHWFATRGATPPGSTWTGLQAWQWLAGLLLTGDGSPRKSWTAKQGFPAPSERGIDTAEKTRRQDLKQSMARLAGRLVEAPDLHAHWLAVQRLPPRGLDPDQAQLLAALFRVLLHAAAELRLVFQQLGEVDFAEIQLRAQQAVGTPDEPTDLALSLDYRLQHLLVDEFQDTSSSQFRLLQTLTAGWMPGDGRTLFAVGDPMQSIYRFREAEVGLFLAARDHGIGHLRLQPLRLTVNFRSTGAIVDWVNGAFGDILPARADIARGAVPYAPAAAHETGRDPAAVQVHASVELDPAAEAARVVALVGDALAETPDGTVAVLARARSHLAQIAAALGAAGIGFQALDVEPLARQPVVRDLHALTRALMHPADRLSWLTVLRAPWLGLTLDNLVAIAEPAQDCVPARLRDPAVQAALSVDGRTRVARLLEILGHGWPARGQRALRQHVEAVWLRLGGAAVAGAAHRLADAQAYLALLDRHERAGGLDDFEALEEALAELYAAPDPRADGRVQLMTMHKAKGLEFDTVILPGLGRGARGDPGELLYWTEVPDDDGEIHLLMAPVRAHEQDEEPLSDYLRALEKERGDLETARLLYVAATRAQRRLHLLGHVGSNGRGVADRPRGGSLLEKLWPAVAERYAQLTPDPAPDDGQVPARLGQLWRLPADWRPSIATQPGPTEAGGDPEPGERIEFDWAGDTARLVGTLVHRYLERIARDGPAAWPEARVAGLAARLRAGLRQLGVAATELDAAADKALRALRQTLADETGRWILGAHADARCEWALTWFDGEPRHYVIDRSFVDDDGRRWIVDYKTGEHRAGDGAAFLDREQQRYREQLETYARVVRRLEDRPIRLALYFPLFPAWRSWDFDDCQRPPGPLR